MSDWTVEFTKDACKDTGKLREPTKSHVYLALDKVSRNPLPFTEGGYGKPLGNKRGDNLTGCFKIKLKGDGIRVIYRLERAESVMRVIIVSVRDEAAVYKEAVRRLG
ncbi:type II toxin-antitoxin system RelE/ParE family toxin [Bifidobacterium sp. SO1]|nr:type II toxin-antitoxin system RelE/ParE family toxin [Bifidobacterium sp. SO1]